MSSNNQHKPGYKHTPLGWIPEEWEMIELKKLTSLITNGFVGKATDSYTNESDGIIYIQGYNVQELSFNFNGIKYITPDFHQRNKKSILKENDLLMVQTGDVGLTAIVPKELEGANCHALIINRFIDDVACPKFYHQYLNSPVGRMRLKVIETGSTMKHINVGDLVKWIVPHPPLIEQRKIAAILSTWDEAITKTQQLIAQVQQRNNGIMQQLLTGKKRLKGFVGEWKKILIGDVITESRIPSSENNVHKRITVRLNQKGIEQREVRGTEAEDATYYFTRKKGQFIYGKQNLHKGAFGIIPDELDGFESSQDIPAFDFKTGSHPKFFIYYLGQENIYPALEKYATGTGSKRIHPENLYKVPFAFPCFKEQEAIAKVLDAAVDEVKLYEQKLAALQQQKKGLMQKLLTGEVRTI